MSERLSTLGQEIDQIKQQAFEHEGRLSNLAFSASQSSEAVQQRMKESQALLDEPNPSPVESQLGPRKKKKPLTEVPLFTFHGGSSDGDGGAPTGQEKDRRNAAYWERKQNSRMTLKNR
jgi:hypothetical protein